MVDAGNSLHQKMELLRQSFMDKLAGKIGEAEKAWDEAEGSGWDRVKLAEAHRIVHSIAGSGSVFGFAALGSCARNLEKLLKSIAAGEFPDPEELKPRVFLLLEELKSLAVLKPQDAVPVAPAVETTRFVPPKGIAVGFREKRIIFLLEDDILQLENLAIQIGHFGYTVKTFSRPEDLREALKKETPSAVVMDIVLQDNQLGGFETVAEIKKLEKFLPVIFISYRNDLDFRLQGVRAGGDAYFVKPVNITELIEKLDSLTTQQKPNPYRIFIVEDEIELAAYYSGILEQAGMATAVTSNPLQILDTLIEFNPDLILMDMYMPGCNGQELAKTIRQMGAYISIPIVFLSAETNINKQLTAMRMGGDDFLTKPIHPDHLISSVAIRAERMRIMRSMMEKDGLTGLLNHTKTREQLDIAVERARRQNSRLTLAMIDIDQFKSVNDTYGHPTGDRVLVGLSRLLQQRLRKTDVIGRYGGEEFAVILIDTDLEAGRAVIEQIRSSFAQIKHMSEGHEFTVTFSAGLASFPQYGDAVSLGNAADKALYRAKNEGRNRTCS